MTLTAQQLRAFDGPGYLDWIANRDLARIVPVDDDALVEYARRSRVAAE
jgi:hypothetical protein